MRKKYLSALLFGALLFASAGTFTSCKDYDDDIDNLQSQISANASAIEALKKVVESGDYVTGVEKSADGLTITFKNAGPKTITLEDKVGSVVTINEDGYLCIDGKATDIKAATATEAKKDQIIIENGIWSVLQEDGTYKSTGIPVSGVTVSGSEADGYIFTIYDENGDTQTVKLPSASSSITSVTIGASATTNNGKVDYLMGEFKFNANSSNILSSRADWKGTRTLPADGDMIYSLKKGIPVRINPVTVDATPVKFYLTTTSNKDVLPFVMTATADYVPNGGHNYDDVDGRAAENGLYTINAAGVVVEKANVAGVAQNLDNVGGKALAVNAGHSCKSTYSLQIGAGTTFTTVKKIGLWQSSSINEDIATEMNASKTAPAKGTASKKYVVGKAVKVYTDQDQSLYDMYLSADEQDVNDYGLTFDQAAHTFTIGKNPDIESLTADFDLTVYTIDNLGNVKNIVVTVNLSPSMAADAVYETITHDVSDVNNNRFGIDLSIMTAALGDNLNAWKQNVDLNKTTVGLYSNKNCTNAVANTGSFRGASADNGFKAILVETVKSGATETLDRNKAKYIQVNITNSSMTNEIALGSTYYIKATFKTSASEELNSIVVPVIFKAPTLTEQFVQETAVFDGNTAKAYMNIEDQLNGTANTGYMAYTLKNAFVSMPAKCATNNITFSLSDNDAVYSDANSDDLAKLGTTEGTAATTKAVSVDADITKLKIYLDKTKKNSSNIVKGYGKDLTITATQTYFADSRFKYDASKGDNEYTFKINVMSPIYEGTVSAINSIVTIPATGTAYKFGNSDIKGTTYNAIEYKVLPDGLVGAELNKEADYGKVSTAQGWTRKELSSVSVTSKTPTVVTVGNSVNAAVSADGKSVVDGYIELKPANVNSEGTGTVEVVVTDIWGMTKAHPIDVKVTRNN